MALQEKYFYNYKNINDLEYRVEILEDVAETITPQEIETDVNPFIVEYPAIENKLQVIRGSGCEMNLLSETDMQFINLYTSEMMKYQIRHYQGNDLIWCGYTTSEMYKEPFNSIDNYPVQLTGTDGFSLLDRLNFVDADGNPYTGIKTIWEIIKIIINKLTLPFNAIYYNVSTIVNGYPASGDETIFHKQYVICSNYYDEDNKPFTCRQVLEEVLRYFGFIQQINGSIYITDNNILCTNGNVTFKQFNPVSFLYIQDAVINMNIGDISSKGFADSNQNLDIVNGINKQKLTYSPYKLIDIIDFNDDFTGFEFETEHGTSPYRWKEMFYTTSPSWYKGMNPYNNGYFCRLQGIEENNEKEKDAYIKINRYTTDTGFVPETKSFVYKKQLPYIIPSGYKLKVSVKTYWRKVEDLNNPANIASELYGGSLFCNLVIGDKKFVCGINYIDPAQHPNPTEYWNLVRSSKLRWGSWQALTEPGCLQLDFRQNLTYMKIYGVMSWVLNTPFEDKWVDLQDYYYQDGFYEAIVKDYLIPLDGITGGQMIFEIYDWDAYKQHHTKQVLYDATLNAKIHNVRIKDLKISLVDANGNEIDQNDNEYVAYLNKNFKNEGSEIKAMHGTNSTDNPVERGSLLGWDGTKYIFLNNWTREGKTSNIESLLLRSIVSNYTDPSIQLTCTLNLINNPIGFLTCNNYLASKQFLVAGMKQNYSENTSEVAIIEINKDNLDISTSF